MTSRILLAKFQTDIFIEDLSLKILSRTKLRLIFIEQQDDYIHLK